MRIQWHRHGGLPHATPAELAGLSPHQLHRLEQSHKLPAVLMQSLAVGYALGLAPRQSRRKWAFRSPSRQASVPRTVPGQGP